MKTKHLKQVLLTTCLIVVPVIGYTQTADFSGAHVGVRFGVNRSDASGNGVNVASQNKTYPGFSLGYGWQMDSFYVGLETFADYHVHSTTGKDAGLDLKLGLPNQRWMPYVKLGVVGTTPYRMHQGVGLAYGLNKNWSVDAEWTHDRSTLSGLERSNHNLSVGLHYYLK